MAHTLPKILSKALNLPLLYRLDQYLKCIVRIAGDEVLKVILSRPAMAAKITEVKRQRLKNRGTSGAEEAAVPEESGVREGVSTSPLRVRCGERAVSVHPCNL